MQARVPIPVCRLSARSYSHGPSRSRLTLFFSPSQDALNHSSIVEGARLSGAKIKAFKHNCVGDVELLLQQAVAGKGARYNKILVIVEGIYSMEGELCQLKEIVAVCKLYGAYVWLDEAHSIGAVGATGRGVCEELGVDPADIDVMMGTFTKSFNVGSNFRT